MPVFYAVSSNKVSLRPIDIEVDFSIFHNTATTTGATYEICELGKFKYDFDLTTDVDNVDKIGIRAGAVTISFFDNNDAEYPSIYDMLFSSGIVPQHIDADISIYNPSGTYTPDIIKCRFNLNDVSYDINGRKTTIAFNPLRPSDVTDSIADIMDNSSRNVYFGAPVTTPSYPDGMVVRDFIDEMLDEIYGSTGSNLIISNLSDTDPDILDRVWMVLRDKQDTEDLLTASEQLANIAGVEGAVFGNMLGQKIYFARNLVGGQTVTMNESDFKDLKLDNTRQMKYKQLKVTHGAFSDSSTIGLLDPNSSKTANFSFRQGNLSKREISNDGPLLFSYRYKDASNVNELDYTDATLAQFGVASYEKLLLNEYIPRISGTIFDCTKIKPHECMVISFGTTKTSRLIGSLSGTYRFSSVTYDFQKDTMQFNAYKIA
jgi:hypothetical protein